MKPFLFIAAISIIFLTAYTTIHKTDLQFSKEAYNKALAKKRFTTISCVPDWSPYYLSPVYDELQDWLIPARHFLGYALLNAGINKAAENVFKEDLKVQPNNETAKKGLAAAQRK